VNSARFWEGLGCSLPFRAGAGVDPAQLTERTRQNRSDGGRVREVEYRHHHQAIVVLPLKIGKHVLYLCVRYLPTNGCLHQIAESCGLLDPGARFGSHMEKQLTAIDRRKEVLPEPWNQQECR
jgi:hypothetical protein